MNLLLDAPESALEREAIRLSRLREATGDKQQLRKHGVVHTPLPLVRFALQRVHAALITQLGVATGLCSERVSVLDPAAGAGVWLAALLALTEARAGRASVLGFDTDPEALATARSLLAPEATARDLTLTLRAENTLGLADPWPQRDTIRVMIGNPPWGARSLSKGLLLSDEWLREFHHDAAGQPLNERRSGVLSDDYVRFFRWALQQAREGREGAIICFVTNASYLDGPVHRGMRAALLHAFDEIELIDLGGNALLSQSASQDQSLFPVRVGAALTLCIRRPGQHQRSASVSYSRLHGARSSKLDALQGVLPSSSFCPRAPNFRFRLPSEERAERPGLALDRLFPFHAEGVQTNRDAVATADTSEELLTRLQQLATGELVLAASRHFEPALARQRIAQALSQPEQAVARLAYRPFEERMYCKLAPLCHRPRPQLERAMQHSSLALLCVRKEPGAARWNMFGVAHAMADSSFLSTRSACRTRLFPSHTPDGAPNLAFESALQIAERVGRIVSSLEVIGYVLGVLGSPLFRAEQAEALKHDYPRIPLPCDLAGFERSLEAGQKFTRILAGQTTVQPEIWLKTQCSEHERVSIKTLRWLAPHHIELTSGTEIGAGSVQSLSAQVGHHAIVASVYRPTGEATIRTVLEACQRAFMWGEAEKAADAAYRPASSVRPNANGVAVID